MRFLIAFVAVLGYTSANLIGPLGYGLNLGDAQAAAIDATVVAQDHARAAYEQQARAAESAIQYNTEAARQVAETHRDINENVYWGSVAANQNAVAAAQSQAAAISGAVAGRAGYGGYAGYGAAPYLAAPYSAAPYGIAGAGYLGGLAAPYGLGLRAW